MDKQIRLLRREIDQIDDQILNLLIKRLEKTQAIGEIQKRAGKAIYDPARERQILERLKTRLRKPLSEEALGAIFREIFNAAHYLECPLRIAYLGPEATFTHQAALKSFGPQAHYFPQKSISSVFAFLEKKEADYGIVPVENSTEGIVSHTLDMFFDSDLKIVNEVVLPVRHHLLSFSKLNQVREVYSHPQALAQCEQWLDENLPDIVRHEVQSTAEAARFVKKRKGALAAIASEVAADLYHIPIIARDIQDSGDNYTRFLVVGDHFAERSGQDKTSILFSTKDRVGALHDMLTPFRKEGINLTKIESRPTKRRAWEYVFFVDFLGYYSDPPVQKALAELENLCIFLKILGSYPVADEA